MLPCPHCRDLRFAAGRPPNSMPPRIHPPHAIFPAYHASSAEHTDGVLFKWNLEDSSSGSESDSVTPVPRKRSGTRARHPYKRAKSEEKEENDMFKGKAQSGPALHNEVEKRRRAYLSSCYVDLKNLVPQIAGVKASNVTILQTAASHVQELDTSAKKLTAQLRAAKRRREQLETQLETLRTQQAEKQREEKANAAAAAAATAWSPPQVGYSSGYESAGSSAYDNDYDGASVVPDTWSTDVDSDRGTPSFSMVSAPVWTGKVKAEPLATPSGIDLLMLLAASASVGAAPSPAAELEMAAAGGRRQARKPARFL
eukprot:gene14736-17301_t